MINLMNAVKLDTVILTATSLMLVGIIYFTQFAPNAGNQTEPGAIYAVSDALLSN